MKLENNNYNFSTANLDALQVDYDDQHNAYTECEGWYCVPIWIFQEQIQLCSRRHVSRTDSLMQVEDIFQKQI